MSSNRICPACGSEVTEQIPGTGKKTRCPNCGTDLAEMDSAEGIAVEGTASAELETPEGSAPTRDARKAYPTIGQAILLLLFFVILTILLYIPAGIVAAILQTEILNNIALGVLLEILAAAIIIFWGFKKTRCEFDEVFPMKRFSLSLALPMACTITGVSILLSELDNLLTSILPPPVWFREAFMEILTDPLAAVFTLIVVAPLIEETICRGLILNGFLKNYSRKKAVLVSAFLFAALHLNPWQFTGAFVYGILFAYLYIRTQSLLPCYLGHAIANSIPIVIMYFISTDIPGYTSSPAGVIIFQPLWFDIFGLALAGIGLWWLLKLLQQKSENTSIPV